MSFIGAWDRAEETLFGLLVQWTGTTAGKTALNDDDRSRLNAFSFIVSGGNVQGQNFQSAIPSCSFNVTGELVGYYQRRADAKEVASRIIEHLPLSRVRDSSTTPRNIQDFSLLTFPTTTRTVIPLPNTEQDVLVWQLVMSFRVVFNGLTT